MLVMHMYDSKLLLCIMDTLGVNLYGIINYMDKMYFKGKNV